MDNGKQSKKRGGISQGLSRFRGWVQGGAALLSNLHLPNFLRGGIYQGKGKAVCVPGLNCYSCPAASGACPIGSFQAVVGSSKFAFSYYITGFLLLLGVLLGRFICGFLCPFGWFQELLHKIPTRKLSTRSSASTSVPRVCWRGRYPLPPSIRESAPPWACSFRGSSGY